MMNLTAYEMRDIALSGGKCNRTAAKTPDEKRRRRNLMARVRRIKNRAQSEVYFLPCPECDGAMHPADDRAVSMCHDCGIDKGVISISR
jgi:hypothetical protein